MTKWTKEAIALLEEAIRERKLAKYEIVKRPGDGLLLAQSLEFGVQLWARGSRNGYKAHECAKCLRQVPKNTETMYRPMGNSGNRMMRICRQCGDEGQQ